MVSFTPPAPPSKPHKEVQIIAIGIALIILVGIYFFGRTWWQDEKREQADYQSLVTGAEEASYPTITPESLQKMLATPGEKFVVIDIRAREDYTLSHIPNALSYPDTTVTTVNLPLDKKLIIIGSETDVNLNEQIAKYLNEKGANFAFLKGGYSTWTSLNSAVVTTGDQTSFVDQSKIEFVTTEELKKRFQAGEQFFILDVQSKENYQVKHLKDAVNIPLTELESRINEVPSGRKIIVYGTNEAESFQGGITLFDLNRFGAEVIAGSQVLNSGLFTEGQ